MKKNVLMIVNPISGGIDKLDFVESVKNRVSILNLNLIQYDTSGINDRQLINALYNKYKPERILIVGGDGTIKMVADAMGNKDVILGILPAGTSNGLAVDLNLSRSWVENLDIAFNNNYLELDTIIINNQKCFHLSDLGLNAEFLKNYKKSKIRGKWGYFFQAIKNLLDFRKPFIATITANDTKIVCKARMIVIANSKKYGTGIVINPNGVMNDGKFELVILKDLDFLLFRNILMGSIPMKSEKIEIISTDRATIKTNSLISFQIDGEFGGYESELEISMSPYKTKIAIP